MSDIYFLQDSRSLVGDNLMFWALGGGYTSDLLKAEPFSKDEAIAQNKTRETDIPWPASYLQSRFYTPVDMQYLKHVDRNARDVGFYDQIPGQWHGNDCLWISGDKSTTDLREATVFCSLQPGRVMWPAEEIHKIARPAVRASDVSLKQALAGSGITLRKPKRIKRDVFNCHHCGRFISEDKRYFDCPNCGGDNRP